MLSRLFMRSAIGGCVENIALKLGKKNICAHSLASSLCMCVILACVRSSAAIFCKADFKP